MKLITDIALVILGIATLFCVIFGACLEHENPFGGLAMGCMLAALTLILYNSWSDKDDE